MKYFDLSEFDSPDKPGSGLKMKDECLEMTDEARGFSGVPFKINSGFRTKEHNEKVGGKADSAHLSGYAIDVSATSSRQRFAIIAGLLSAGFTRIGIAKTFIHADCDPSKPEHVVWVY